MILLKLTQLTSIYLEPNLMIAVRPIPQGGSEVLMVGGVTFTVKEDAKDIVVEKVRIQDDRRLGKTEGVRDYVERQVGETTPSGNG